MVFFEVAFQLFKNVLTVMLPWGSQGDCEGHSLFYVYFSTNNNFCHNFFNNFFNNYCY